MFCIDICVDVIYLYRYIHDGIDILLITTLLYIYIYIFVFRTSRSGQSQNACFWVGEMKLVWHMGKTQCWIFELKNRNSTTRQEIEVCVWDNLDTEQRAQGRIFGFLFWFGLLGPARMIQVWFVRISCHNPGSMLIDGVMVVHCPLQEKLQCDPEYFWHRGDPALGWHVYHAGNGCMFCWHFLDSRFLSPFVESVTKDSFTAVAKDILNNNKDVVGLMAEGIQALQQLHPEQCDSTFVDNFLDQFLLNRIGSNVLLNQYLASVDKNLGWTWFFDCAHFDDFDLLCYCFFLVFLIRVPADSSNKIK